MKRLPDYPEKVELSKTLALEGNAARIADTQELISQHLKESAQGLIELTNIEDPTIRLQAIKHHLKLGGLEVEKHQHEGNLTFEPFKISRGSDE